MVACGWILVCCETAVDEFATISATLLAILVLLAKSPQKTADHNFCRDILSTMGNAFGFVTSKEVVVAPWYTKPDVELQDASE